MRAGATTRAKAKLRPLLLLQPRECLTPVIWRRSLRPPLVLPSSPRRWARTSSFLPPPRGGQPQQQQQQRRVASSSNIVPAASLTPVTVVLPKPQGHSARSMPPRGFDFSLGPGIGAPSTAMHANMRRPLGSRNVSNSSMNSVDSVDSMGSMTSMPVSGQRLPRRLDERLRRPRQNGPILTRQTHDAHRLTFLTICHLRFSLTICLTYLFYSRFLTAFCFALLADPLALSHRMRIICCTLYPSNLLSCKSLFC